MQGEKHCLEFLFIAHKLVRRPIGTFMRSPATGNVHFFYVAETRAEQQLPQTCRIRYDSSVFWRRYPGSILSKDDNIPSWLQLLEHLPQRGASASQDLSAVCK